MHITFKFQLCLSDTNRMLKKETASWLWGQLAEEPSWQGTMAVMDWLAV